MRYRVADRRRSSSRIVAALSCAAALLPWSARGEARLYQWNDPRTGTTQLSGRAPAWYRKDRVDPITQPRVLVFDQGKLIDDSHRRVPDEEQAALRAEAFADTTAAPSGEAPAAEPAVLNSAGSETDAATIERLRTIIRDWDQRQTEHARTILEETNRAR
jgi:hypothetical protein